MARTVSTTWLLDKLDLAIGKLVKVVERNATLVQRQGMINEQQAVRREVAEKAVVQLIADIRARLAEMERQAEANSWRTSQRPRRNPTDCSRHPTGAEMTNRGDG